MAAENSKFTRFNDEVFYTNSPLSNVDKNDIAWLMARAKETPRRRARICAHVSPEADVHEMFIVHERNTYVPPHRHIGRSESYFLISGRMRIVMFDDDGAVTDFIEMAPPESGGAFYYRISEPMFHSMLIDSDWVVFHEVTSGPFDPTTTEYAKWAPSKDETDAQSNFVRKLQEELAERTA